MGNHWALFLFFRAYWQTAISLSCEGIPRSIQQDATQMPVSPVPHGVLESLPPELPGGKWFYKPKSSAEYVLASALQVFISRIKTKTLQGMWCTVTATAPLEDCTCKHQHFKSKVWQVAERLEKSPVAYGNRINILMPKNTGPRSKSKNYPTRCPH